MLRSSVSIAVALVLAGLPIASHAAPADSAAMAAFKTLCGDTSAEFVAVTKAADAGSWRDTDMLWDPMKGVTVTDKTTRTRTMGDAHLSLLASRGATEKGVKVEECLVKTDKADPDLLTAAQSWIGIPAKSSEAHRSSYIFTVRSGARAVLADNEQGAAMTSGGVFLAKFSNDGSTILDLYRFTK